VFRCYGHAYQRHPFILFVLYYGTTKWKTPVHSKDDAASGSFGFLWIMHANAAMILGARVSLQTEQIMQLG
jgi:hypothetical protein